MTRQISQDPGDPSLIVIASMKAPNDQVFVGQHVAQIAEGWKVDAAEAILRRSNASRAACRLSATP